VTQVKLIKDYLNQGWQETADTCEYCEARHEAKVTAIDDESQLGDVHSRVTHREGCPEITMLQGEFVSITEDHDFGGWEFVKSGSGKPLLIPLAGKLFPTIKWRANVGPCLHCWRLVGGAALMLLNDNLEMDFCHECAHELDIMDALTSSTMQPVT
jgi:hypothetical protein